MKPTPDKTEVQEHQLERIVNSGRRGGVKANERKKVLLAFANEMQLRVTRSKIGKMECVCV